MTNKTLPMSEVEIAQAKRIAELELKVLSLEANEDILQESIAKVVYRQWRDCTGYVPWVEGGNSTKQDIARHLAAQAILDAKEKSGRSET